MSHMKFVVVGHPNKGKSSIVATLTQDATVAIGPRPGTTTKSRSFYLKSGDEVLYELIDTPGFQRPKKLLAWLQAQESTDASERPKLLEKFLQTQCPSTTFADECELLRPIVDGAAILYVVDASKPYSAKFEAEMEILRFAARPSMAILNYITDDDYTKEWQAALRQYFSIIKPFNPLKASFNDHIDLLRALSHIAPEWSSDISKTIGFLQKYHQKQKEQIAKTIAKGVCEILSFKMRESYRLSTPNEEKLLQRYKVAIEKKEKTLFKKIQTLLGFEDLDIRVETSKLNYSIFSKESQELFGLSREKILLLATLGTAATGGAIDLAVGGHSLLLGSIIGATVGFLGANYGYGKLSDITIINSNTIEIGPIKDPNIGFILLNRALEFSRLLLHTTHAQRGEKQAVISDESSLKELKSLSSLHKKCQKGSLDESELEKYSKLLLELL